MQNTATQENRIRMENYKNKANKLLFGTRSKSGILFLTFVYIMLIALGFIYLYPILRMFVTSFMSLDDLLDDSVKWIPTHISLENYKQALEVMKFREKIGTTLLLSVVPSLFQTIISAITGYGFARYRFRGKSFLMLLVLLTFVIPPHVMMVPRYLMYSDYKMIGTMGVLVYPAMLGQGLNSAIFILIFTQFFRQTPVSLEEAARVDGASAWHLFKYVQIPGIMLMVDFVLFDNIRGALQVFDIPFVMTSGGPGYASSTFTLYTIKTAFTFSNFGLASTMAMAIMVMIVAIYLIQNKLIHGFILRDRGK